MTILMDLETKRKKTREGREMLELFEWNSEARMRRKRRNV
jgi:hypothetical protein